MTNESEFSNNFISRDRCTVRIGNLSLNQVRIALNLSPRVDKKVPLWMDRDIFAQTKYLEFEVS